MSIAFCKIGKSIIFNHKGASLGGEVEAPALLQILANNNPDKKFYIVGKSNYSRLSEMERLDLFPYQNVIDIWNDGFKHEDVATFIPEYLHAKGIEIDFAICMIGQIGTVTIPGKIKQINNPDLIASVIDMTKNYSTPIIYWLNEGKTRWCSIINDPRYTPAQTRDFFDLPEVSLSQYDYVYEHNMIYSYENQERRIFKVPAKYAEVEKICLYSLAREKRENLDYTYSFNIVLNEGSPSRYNELKSWVLDHFDNTEIYGRWEHKDAISDSRFKGLKPFSEVQNIMASTMATFIIPIAPGWVTSKYIEMVHAGTIPFFHPSYDTQNHLNAPDFLRPKNGAELKERVKRLETDKELRKQLLYHLRKLWCKEHDYDGTNLNRIVMSSMIPDYDAPDLSRFDKIKLATLEDFF